MRNANLVSDELHAAGFRTKVLVSNAVKVDLSNRKLSTMEVEIALDNIFEGINFNCKSNSNSVIVTW